MNKEKQRDQLQGAFSMEGEHLPAGQVRSRDTITSLRIPRPKRIVITMESIFQVQWRQFIANLRSKTFSEPFLVRETNPGEKEAWYFYAKSPTTLVQVMTLNQTRRVWRTVDGAIRDLERELGELPTVTVYGSIEAYAATYGEDG